MSAPAILYHTQTSWIAQLDPQIPAQLDPQIPARSMDSCAKYGSIDCAARSMDRADPQIMPKIYIILYGGKGDQNRDTKLGRDADTGNYSMFHPTAIVWNVRYTCTM